MTTSTARYVLRARRPESIDELRPRVVALLKAEGFGILTEIDVAATLRQKLDIERDPYLILGACNPKLAHRALEAEPSIGALLPCSVTLRADDGGTTVEIMDPQAALGIVANEAVALVAAEARERLTRVAAALAEHA
ncbi:MAG: DUF302 domain-containing protein [Chloroflexota bacterium]